MRVRRGHREDLPILQTLLGAGSPPLTVQAMRRLVDDVRSDLFVAVDAVGGLIGLVGLGYLRLIGRGGQVAVLDTIATRGGPDGLLAALLEFAERRAQQRGCRQLLVLAAAVQPDVRRVLVARGYGSADGMMRCFDETV